MILRLREGHRELNISKSEAESIVKEIANGAEMILIRGWVIMKGDIAHIDPTGLTKQEIDELDKKSLKSPDVKRASVETVTSIRETLEAKGIIKRKGKI